MKANGKSWASVVRTATRTELAQMGNAALDIAATASADAAARYRKRAADVDAEITRRDAVRDAAAERAMRAMGGT